MPSFSVIMPVYNVEKYIEKAIKSVLMQTFEDFELIIVNDGSTDDSMSIVEEFALKDSRIKLMNQRNKGPSAARNIGLKNAVGDYVCFIDSDDEVNINLLKNTRVGIIDNYPDVLMFGMLIEEIGRNNEIKNTIALTTHSGEYSSKTLKNFIIDDNSLELIGYSTNKIYKRSLLVTHNIKFDEKINFLEDMEFNEKVFKEINTFKVIDDCFYHYKRRNRISGINTFQIKHFELQMEAIRSRKEIFEGWGIEQAQIDSVVGQLHMLAIRATCSLLFKHTNDLTFKEKYEYIYSMLYHPLTIYRIKYFSTLTIIDRVLKVVVERRQVYTLAVISSIYAFHFNRFN